MSKYFKKKSRIYRKINKRLIKPIILIVCEGECTEYNYFNSFRVSTSYVVIVKGEGISAKPLIKKTISLKKEIENREMVKIDQVWCVFDKDSNKELNKIIEEGRNNKINIAYSNPAFELWFVLHFIFTTSPMSVKELINKIKKLFSENCGIKYKKNYKNIYDVLESNKNDAIKRSEKLIKFHKENYGLNPEKNNPSTTVHKLVIELDKYSI